MSETLRDLVVSLSLNSDNFTRNIKSIQKQIQEAESAFKLASAGVDIEYMYSLIGRGEDKAYMVFRATDGAKLLAVLAQNNIATISNEELGIR